MVIRISAENGKDLTCLVLGCFPVNAVVQKSLNYICHYKFQVKEQFYGYHTIREDDHGYIEWQSHRRTNALR